MAGIIETSHHVALDQVGSYVVSTVRLRCNHGAFDGVPLWYETMIFKGVDRNVIDSPSQTGGVPTENFGCHFHTPKLLDDPEGPREVQLAGPPLDPSRKEWATGTYRGV